MVTNTELRPSTLLQGLIFPTSPSSLYLLLHSVTADRGKRPSSRKPNFLPKASSPTTSNAHVRLFDCEREYHTFATTRLNRLAQVMQVFRIGLTFARNRNQRTLPIERLYSYYTPWQHFSFWKHEFSHFVRWINSDYQRFYYATINTSRSAVSCNISQQVAKHQW